MEKRHFFAEPGTVGKLIAQQDSEAADEDTVTATATTVTATAAATAAATTPSRGRSAVPGIRGKAASKARRDAGGVSVGAAFPRTPRRSSEDDRRGRSASARRTPLGSPRAPYPGGGGGGAPHFPRQPIASPARMRPASTATGGGGGGGVAAPSPRSRSARSVSRPRNRLRVAPSPTGNGKPPLSPRRKGGTPAGARGGRGRAFFSNDMDAEVAVGGGAGGGGGFATVDEGGDWNWTREELEAWPGREPAPTTPVVSVLPGGGGGGEEGEGREEEGREAFGTTRSRGGVMSGGGMDPPVLTRVLPPGLEVRMCVLYVFCRGGGDGGDVGGRFVAGCFWFSIATQRLEILLCWADDRGGN